VESKELRDVRVLDANRLTDLGRSFRPSAFTMTCRTVRSRSLARESELLASAGFQPGLARVV